MKDLSIQLHNHPGAIAEMGGALAKAGVSVEGGGAWVVDGVGIAHFLFEESIGNINTLFSLFHQEKKDTNDALQPWGIRNPTESRRPFQSNSSHFKKYRVFQQNRPNLTTHFHITGVRCGHFAAPGILFLKVSFCRLIGRAVLPKSLKMSLRPVDPDRSHQALYYRRRSNPGKI